MEKNVLYLPLLREELKIEKHCKICRKTFNIQKTKVKNIKTLLGENQFKFCFEFCKIHGISNEKLHSIINAICPHDRSFDTKVMIAVGLNRWFLNMQREEIQLLFLGRGIEISTGEISNLSEEFLLRFYALHKRYNKMMSSIFRVRLKVFDLSLLSENIFFYNFKVLLSL